MIKLYSYWRSSAAYRVRIALNLKELAYEIVPVHLLKEGGQQLKPDYTNLNPLALLPILRDDSMTLTQSLAIIEYLNDKYPGAPLLPTAMNTRAHAREMAQLIACEIHPLNNLRVLKYLSVELAISDSARQRWYRHWVMTGLNALQRLLERMPRHGPFALGENVSVVDLCLVPQLYNARRFDLPLEDFPLLARIDAACRELPAFQRAAPEAQPDAES